MPESAAEPFPAPYISPAEDEDNAGRLKPDVAHQVYFDIREEAKRRGLEINPNDSPEEIARKNQALKQLFGDRSSSDLPDYQAAGIVDLEEKAGRDPLTGLLNRRRFERLFDESLKQSIQTGKQILFLMVDLDFFKQLNDDYGHLIGDEALKYLARALAEAVEIEDLVCRWGGEEFIVSIKPKGGRPSEADKLLGIAERIRRQIVDALSEVYYQSEKNGEKQPIKIPITLSVGATLTRSDDTLEKACQRADDNLYQAKNSGRNQSFGDHGKIVFTQASPPDVPPKIVSN